jgi:Family of unknown function (DUF5677)
MLDDPFDDEAMKANHERIQRLYAYLHEAVDFVIKSEGAGRGGYKGAIGAVFMRAYYSVWSLSRLDSPGDFQAVQAIGRTLFELYLDLLFLRQDKNSYIKYFDFNKLGWMRRALQMVAFIDENPSDVRHERYHRQREMATDPNKLAECKAILMNHYGKTEEDIKNLSKAIPDSWTGLDLASRIRKLGKAIDVEEYNILMEYYRSMVSEGNWHVHGGAVGIAGRSPEVFASNWSNSLGSSLGMLCRITCIAFAELELLDSVPDLRSLLVSFR